MKQLVCEPGERVFLWVIYSNTLDYPGQTLARVWDFKYQCPTRRVVFADIGKLRSDFEKRGFLNLGRDPGDDPVIQEVWVEVIKA